MRKVSEKQKQRNKEKSASTAEMHAWFREIWDEREDEEGFCYCFETGRALHGSIYRSNTCCYDHVLEKGKNSYPEYAFVKKNIVIIHPDVHQEKGRSLDRVPKIKVYRDYLLSLHYENKLND